MVRDAALVRMRLEQAARAVAACYRVELGKGLPRVYEVRPVLDHMVALHAALNELDLACEVVRGSGAPDPGGLY